MTSELFKDELDRLDSGLPEHPDTSAYKREGRAVRRRRQGLVALGAGALVAAAVAPAVLWGGSTATSGPSGDVASDPSATASQTPPAPEPTPVDASFGTRMRAAVEEAVPGAAFGGEYFYDHKVTEDGVLVGAVSTPPDWANVYSWGQHFTMEGLQFFDVTTEWQRSGGTMKWCVDGAFAIEKGCETKDMGAGVLTVLHDGIRFQGEADGDWTKMVEVISPPTSDGDVQVTRVLAQVEGMTWAEADLALPPIGQLAYVAALEELHLPEPAQVP